MCTIFYTFAKSVQYYTHLHKSEQSYTYLFRGNVNFTLIIQCKLRIFHYFISNLLRFK